MDDPVVRELTQGEVVSNVTTRTVQPARPELSANEVGALRARPERRIVGAPSVLTVGSSALFRASRESALRAVMAAQPFTMLFPEHYEAWKEVEITFDPREKS
jgi:hypothetical protein